ncbi:MAG: hypothetical protein CMH57_08860 [Myxococcales bacterium]|nr:hypothetical protein [Myxococcales bacterium]
MKAGSAPHQPGLEYAFGPRGVFDADPLRPFLDRLTRVGSAGALALDIGSRQRTLFFDTAAATWCFARRCVARGVVALGWEACPPEVWAWLGDPHHAPGDPAAVANLQATLSSSRAASNLEHLARELTHQALRSAPGWWSAVTLYRAVEDACERGGAEAPPRAWCSRALEGELLLAAVDPWRQAGGDMRARLSVLRDWATDEAQAEAGMVRAAALMRFDALTPDLLTEPERDYLSAWLSDLGLALEALAR